MVYNKSYRMTYLIKLLFENGYLKVSDWEDLDVDYDLNRKTILRDVAELKDLLYEIYSYKLIYDTRHKVYQLIDMKGKVK